MSLSPFSYCLRIPQRFAKPQRQSPRMSRADISDKTAIDAANKKRYQECEAVAKTILGDGFAVAPAAEHQGPLNYTFIGTPTTPKCVISFRLEAGRFDPQVLQLAKAIHGDLVPDAASCGYLKGDSELQSLVIYKMSYLPGRDFWSLASQEAQLNKEEAITRRTTLVKSLARSVGSHYPLTPFCLQHLCLHIFIHARGRAGVQHAYIYRTPITSCLRTPGRLANQQPCDAN